MKHCFIYRFIICFSFLLVNHLAFSQSGEIYHNSICTDVLCIYGGAYNLTFAEGSDETTLTIDMPDGISATLVDYSIPSYGIVGVYCEAYPITGCIYGGDRLTVIVNKGVDRYPNGTVVSLTIDTNKPYSYYPYGYYYIHVDLIVNK